MEEYKIVELENGRYVIERWDIEDGVYSVIVDVYNFETALENVKHLRTLEWK